MRVRWHRNRLPMGGYYEFSLFVGEWEWHVRRIADITGGYVESEVFGKRRWYASGPGMEGGRAAMPGSVLTKTLRQAKGRCEDAALRCVEAAAADLGMKVVDDR